MNNINKDFCCDDFSKAKKILEGANSCKYCYVLGPTGPQGGPGPIGTQGEIGPKGDMGLQGPKGDRGDIGINILLYVLFVFFFFLFIFPFLSLLISPLASLSAGDIFSSIKSL